MEQFSFPALINLGLPILFLVLLATFIYFAFTMTHHWGYYSFNAQFKRVAQGTYLLVSIVILIAIGAFMGIYIFGYGF